jgi:hypothetical protein
MSEDGRQDPKSQGRSGTPGSSFSLEGCHRAPPCPTQPETRRSILFRRLLFNRTAPLRCRLERTERAVPSASPLGSVPTHVADQEAGPRQAHRREESYLDSVCCSWRTGWDSNPRRPLRFCKLQIPQRRQCHKCQRCRRALHRVAPKPDFGSCHDNALWGRIMIRPLRPVLSAVIGDLRPRDRASTMPLRCATGASPSKPELFGTWARAVSRFVRGPQSILPTGRACDPTRARISSRAPLLLWPNRATRTGPLPARSRHVDDRGRR